MPKDEFDPEDPLELFGVGIVTDEDTTEAMTECFIEEFMRLGYNHKQLLALFRNPHYTGLNMVLQNKGEPFVRERIAEAFAKRGRSITWPKSLPPSPIHPGAADNSTASSVKTQRTTAEVCSETDPMGASPPDINL